MLSKIVLISVYIQKFVCSLEISFSDKVYYIYKAGEFPGAFTAI